MCTGTPPEPTMSSTSSTADSGDGNDDQRLHWLVVDPETRADILDFVGDFAHDAVDLGIPADEVADALRDVADEIEEYGR